VVTATAGATSSARVARNRSGRRLRVAARSDQHGNVALCGHRRRALASVLPSEAGQRHDPGTQPARGGARRCASRSLRRVRPCSYPRSKNPSCVLWAPGWPLEHLTAVCPCGRRGRRRRAVSSSAGPPADSLRARSGDPHGVPHARLLDPLLATPKVIVKDLLSRSMSAAYRSATWARTAAGNQPHDLGMRARSLCSCGFGLCPFKW
jgi:hypothetical protein